MKFAFNRLQNPESELISTQDILDWISLLDVEEKNGVWFTAKIK